MLKYGNISAHIKQRSDRLSCSILRTHPLGRNMSRGFISAILLGAALICIASAQSGRLTVLQYFSGSACNGSLPDNMLTVTSGACVVTQQATVKITDLGNNSVSYSYGCNPGCNQCLINGVADINSCAAISTIAGNFNATVIRTRYPAYTTTQYYTNRTADFSTCSNPQASSDTTLQVAQCYQERKTNLWQQFIAFQNNPWNYTFGFNRNCTDNTCNICYVNAVYYGGQKCGRINLLDNGSDFGYINTITDGTPSPTTTNPSGTTTNPSGTTTNPSGTTTNPSSTTPDLTSSGSAISMFGLALLATLGVLIFA